MTLAGLAARNVLRNRFRAILTILGVAVAVLTFVFLRTVVGAWTTAAEYARKDRIVTRHKITFVMTLPKPYINDVRSAPHVKDATFANWFGGKDPKHDREFFATLAVDVPSFFKVFDDMNVPEDQLEAWKHDPEGAIVGDVLAKKMGWKLGDKVMLVSGIYADKSEWEFHVDGIYTATGRSVDRSTFVFNWDYLDKSVSARRQNQIGWIVSRVDDPSKTASIATQLDTMFDSKEVPTLSQDEHAFQASFLAGISAVLTALDVISVVILAIMMLILGNTIAMGVRERTGEYGALKALGFSGGHLAFFIVSESILIGAIGSVLGVALAFPFVEKGLGRYLEENMGAFFPYFRVSPMVALTAVLGTLLLSAAAAAIPAMGASRLRVVDALRRVA